MLLGNSQNHNEVWLRWLDLASSCAREERVIMLDAGDKEIVLSSRTPLEDRTGVSLWVGDDSASGVVIACQPDQDKFIVIIQKVPSARFPESVERDPGVLAIDDFLSEEQERLLLEEIDEEWQGSSKNTRATAN